MAITQCAAISLLVALPLTAEDPKLRAASSHAAAHIRQQFPSLDAPEALKYVAAIVDRLRPGTKIEINNSPDSQPTLLPNGEIFLPANFLLNLRNEDQLTFQLAHLIGHLTLNHIAITRASNPFVLIGPLHANQLPRFKELEVEADNFAIQTAANAGIDPRSTKPPSPEFTRIQEILRAKTNRPTPEPPTLRRKRE